MLKRRLGVAEKERALITFYVQRSGAVHWDDYRL
jgi:hypothetical protein